ncbi:MAG: hydroxymethylglutaryl-CoA reductase, degradative [Caldilineaceae bacterium]|nr:hydroxymethylglutaryl-CoA reductase, degradative [Caldilineaceae bacterium]
MNPRPSSRLSGYYQKSIEERVAILAEWADLCADEVDLLHTALTLAQADKMIENVVGRYALPLGVGANFLINGDEHLIPMVIEEPSVVAAVSFAARLARTGGGFFTGSTDPIMIAQIQLLDVPDPVAAERAIRAEEADLLAAANTSSTIARLGGGPRRLEIRHLADTAVGPMLIVHLHFDCRDAMGANAVNTAAETIAPRLETLSGGRVLLRILSNLTDQRRAWAEVLIPAASFSTHDYSGEAVVQGIVEANAFALADPYRATTHNKGIFNGIDAVLIATSNDWRAVAAGGHAYAARSGQYRALTDWRWISGIEDFSAVDSHPFSPSRLSNIQYPALYGRLEMPLSVGIVGGATRTHPLAGVALKILGVTSARQLSEIVVAVGLAQNLAAVRALVTDGIQRGHMRLHARQIAITAGAREDQVDPIATRLVHEGTIRVERARELLTQIGQP